MEQTPSYLTPGGVRVHCQVEDFDPAELAEITRRVQDRRGGVLSSGMEYPGRYSRWHIAYLDPPVQIVARGRTITAQALNERGRVLMPVIAAALAKVGDVEAGDGCAQVTVAASDAIFTEEQRSRRPTVFTALREVIAALAGPVRRVRLRPGLPVRAGAPADPA